MRVTDEMEARAWSEYGPCTIATRAHARAYLQAALADVPEPAELQRRIEFTAERWRIECEAQEQSARLAQAKLAAVREVVRELRAEIDRDLWSPEEMDAVEQTTSYWADRLEAALGDKR